MRVNRSTENVTVTNCIVHHGSAAVTLGSEMSGSIRNVVVSNIACQGTWMGLNIKSDRGRGGVVENVRMDHWTMDDVGRAINVTQYYVLEARVNSTEQKVSERTPVYRNIVVDNMSINRCRATVGFEKMPPVMINIEGLPEMPISGLRLTNIIALGKSGLKAHDTVGMELHNVQVNTDSGPGFEGTRVGRRVHARAPGGRPRDPAGSLPRRHRARDQGLRGHRDVSLDGFG